MGNCLLTQLKASVENGNLLKFGEISFRCKVNRNANFIINLNKYSGFSFVGDYSLDIISDTTTLSDGTKHYEGNGDCVISPTTIGEIFTLKIKSKYDFTKVNLDYTPDDSNSPVLAFLDAYLDRFKYSLEHLDPTTTLRGVRLDNIKDYYYYVDKNGNYYFPIFVNDNNPGSRNYIKGTLKEMIDARTVNGLLYNKAETRDEFISYNDVVIEKDLSQYPANVSYINVSRNCTWTSGVRNSSNCFILCGGGNDNSGFKTADDLNNYFIDNAKCTIGTDAKIMYWFCSETYSPSLEAQTAIEMLKQKGVTSIKVNGVQL